MQPRTPRSYALAVPTGDYRGDTTAPPHGYPNCPRRATVDGVAQADAAEVPEGGDPQAAGREPDRGVAGRPGDTGAALRGPTPSRHGAHSI